MKSPILFAAALAGLILCACQAGTSSAAPAPVSSASARPTAQDFNTLARGNHSGLIAAQALVIRTASGWSQEWSLHESGGDAALPAVDFATEMVVLIALGDSPGANASVTIERVLEDSGFLRVEARASGVADSPAGARSQPYHMVKLARSDAPVQFQITR